MRIRFYILFILICNIGVARPMASLPGGLLFPMFPSAALTNAAALTADWREELNAFYSPPANEGEPHSYMAGFAKSGSRFGFNLGYSGSTQEGSYMHNAFVGGSFRLAGFSFGIAGRKLDISGGGNPLNIDLSAIYNLARIIRLGFVSYDVGNSRQIGLGIGFGKPGRFTLEVDALVPSTYNRQEITTEYSATAAATFFIKDFGIAAGYHYSHLPFEGGDTTTKSINAGLAYRFAAGLSAVGLYNSNPTSFSIGISWTDGPSTQEYSKFFQKRNDSVRSRH